MHFIIFLALLFSSSLNAFQKEDLPPKFCYRPNNKIDGQVTAYLLEVRGESPFGFVERRKEKERIFFSFKLTPQNEIAFADVLSANNFSKITVFAKDEGVLGTIWHRRFSLYPAKYEIYDGNEYLLGQGEMNWVGSRFSITSLDNKWKEIVSFQRPYFRMPGAGDYWYVHIKDYESIDPRIVVMIGAFQTELEKKDSPIRG